MKKNSVPRKNGGAVLPEIASVSGTPPWQSDTIIVRFNAKGFITFINPYGQEFFGFPGDELLGKPALGTIFPVTGRDGRNLAGVVREIIAYPHLYEMKETENVRRDGSRVWIAWKNRAITDGEDKVREILAIGTDITVWKHSEEALFASEERYRNLVDMLPDAIVLHYKGRIVFANPAAVDLFGAGNHKDLVGRSISSFIHPEDAGVIKERIWQAPEEDAVVPTREIRMARTDGTVVFGEVTSRSIPFQDERLVFSVFHDITGRRVAEEHLAFQARLLENVNDAIISCDQDFVVTSFNGVAEEIYGYPAAEVIGKTLHDVIASDSSEKAVEDEISELERTGKSRA
ncbi:MAG: PAS domain S-box protein, partial [Methanoregulaceae archaeon]|nr:PAS domain S-box protein [Methanoregulaceae archaeon]